MELAYNFMAGKLTFEEVGIVTEDRDRRHNGNANSRVDGV